MKLRDIEPPSRLKMTAAHSPWMNGSCERNHATVDKLVDDKLIDDEPRFDLQKAVDIACFVIIIIIYFQIRTSYNI